jgi:hypothetical protein
MSSDIIKQNLSAYTIREAKGMNGIRTVGGEKSIKFIPEWLQNVAGTIWEFSTKLGGFVWGKISSAFNFTFTGVWGFLTSSVQFLWSFNWDATDQQLDSLLSGIQIQLSAQLGGTLGNLAGFLVCGAVPGAAMLKFNKMLAVRILKEVGEEALEELGGNLSALCSTAFLGLAQTAMISIFKSARRNLKNYFKDPTSNQSRFMKKIFGAGFDNFIASWGDGKNNYSFSNQTEEALDRIPNELVREFLEEFLEEFAEACIEAGYIVAGGLDEWVAQQKTQREAILGEEKILEITPNRAAGDEKIILAGNEALVKSALPSVIASHQLVENRDIGQFMGSTVQSHVKKDRLELGIRIVWKTKPRPPWGDADSTECTIEGIDRSKLEWDIIKLLAGGVNGYMWGRFRATANLSNGGQFVINAGTKDEAEDMAKKLLTLSEFDVLTLSVTESLKEGLRATGKQLEIESKRVYPAYLTIINQKKLINEQRQGVQTLTGTYKRRSHQLNLWTTKEPLNFKDIVQELLRDGTGI